jgi:hypothetical protein
MSQYGGTYKYDDNMVYIYPETGNAVLFYINLQEGPPSYNMGSIDGKIIIRDGKATFQKNLGYGDKDCIIKFVFDENKLTLTQETSDCDCGFGMGVYANGAYKRTSSEIPQFYYSGEGEKIYFKDWKEE